MNDDFKRLELSMHGRGASGNIPNRFEPISYESLDELAEGPVEEVPGPRRTLYKDIAFAFSATNDRPTFFTSCRDLLE